MKGLYLNVSDARRRIEEVNDLLGHGCRIAESSAVPGLHIHVNYRPEDWPGGPIFSDPTANLLAAGAGWFLYDGKPGNLEAFVRAFTEVPRPGGRAEVAGKIEAGAFLIVIHAGGVLHLITDPFGLHPHYCLRGSEPLRLAPSPAFLDAGAKHPLSESVLQRQNHLFGNLTAYEKVERLEPGAVTSDGRVQPYFDYSPREFDTRTFLEEVHRVSGLLPERKRILPLSGGLDSRLLLSEGRFDFGYTFGPCDSGDRPVARRFKDHFERYEEFSLLDLSYPSRLQRAAEILFDGTCSRPFDELLPVYDHVRCLFGRGCLFFDGYGGDVLQRAIYIAHDGFFGTLMKFVPAFTGTRFDPVRLLRQRYHRLPDDAVPLLLSVFEEKTSGWTLDPARRLILFEILYGRGSRWIMNGAGTMSQQFFTTVQPFVTPRVFPIFFGLDPFKSRTFANLRRIWSAVPAEFSSVATYSRYKPTWRPTVSRTVNFSVKALERLRLVRSSRTYEVELPRVKWEHDTSKSRVGAGKL